MAHELSLACSRSRGRTYPLITRTGVVFAAAAAAAAAAATTARISTRRTRHTRRAAPRPLVRTSWSFFANGCDAKRPQSTRRPCGEQIGLKPLHLPHHHPIPSHPTTRLKGFLGRHVTVQRNGPKVRNDFGIGRKRDIRGYVYFFER